MNDRKRTHGKRKHKHRDRFSDDRKKYYGGERPVISNVGRGVYDPARPEAGLVPVESKYALPWMDEDLDLLEPPVADEGSGVETRES